MEAGRSGSSRSSVSGSASSESASSWGISPSSCSSIGSAGADGGCDPARSPRALRIYPRRWLPSAASGAAGRTVQYLRIKESNE